MKILPNLPSHVGLHRPGPERDAPLRAVSAIDRSPREYPQADRGADSLARALLAQRQMAAGIERERQQVGTEPLRVRKALDAYQERRQDAERDYLSSVLGIDDFA